MSLLQRFEKTSSSATPVLIKVAVMVQLLFLLLPTTFLVRAPRGQAALAVVALLLQAVLLIGIWNLRRWALLSYAVLVVVGFLVSTLTSSAPLTADALWAWVLGRGIILLPGLVYWRRMS